MSQLTIYKHIIKSQEEIEKMLLGEYEKGTYSLYAPFIKVNPYGNAPLTALVMFETLKATAIKVTVLGKNEAANIYLNYPKRTKHILDIIGLYPNKDNTIILKTDEEEVTFHIKTEKVFVKIPSVSMCLDNPGMKANKLNFIVPTDNKFFTAGFDSYGDCRWYTNLNFSYSMKRGLNGRFLVGAPRLLAIPYSPTSLYEISLLGKVYREYRLPRGYHHDYFEINNEKMLLLTQNIEEGTSGDIIALFDKNTGDILKEWNLKNILPQDVAGSGSQDMHDWFHSNAIFYDQFTESITVSGRHQDIIVNFDAKEGKIRWMLGDPEGWPDEYISRYFLRMSKKSEWFYEPHAVQYLGNNRIICFDSGHYRAKVKSKYVLPENNYSRAVIYEINMEQKTVSEVWQYGKELGNNFYSTYMGNISIYGENHYGIHSGGRARVHGKSIDMPGVFRKDFDDETELSSINIEWYLDKEIGRIIVNTNTYQSQWINIQDDRDFHQWIQGKIIGKYASSEEVSIELPMEPAGFVPDRYNLSFEYDGERLCLSADFVAAEMVLLILEGEKENHTFFIQSTRRPFYTMCPVTWRPGKSRPVEWPIVINNFSDCYRLKLLVNENLYSTGITLDLRKER